MNKELMITKEDLVNWLDRSPSNDDLDLIGFITTRLENFYKLQERIDKAIDYITTEQLYTHYQWGKSQYQKILKDLLQILQGGNNENN